VSITDARPAILQQHRAAASSARTRSTNRLERELRNAIPLTAEQRARLITAAASIPVVTEAGAA
jgi:hypothetical protein